MSQSVHGAAQSLHVDAQSVHGESQSVHGALRKLRNSKEYLGRVATRPPSTSWRVGGRQRLGGEKNERRKFDMRQKKEKYEQIKARVMQLAYWITECAWSAGLA